ncbi:hypothetical protein TNCV_4522151 [Trichonephila clavipes]|nr:hypothetical protein TNCV_4522151 [Trichonephila clavipes]
MSEGRFDLSTFRSERTNEASTLTITPKRSSSRDVVRSSIVSVPVGILSNSSGYLTSKKHVNMTLPTVVDDRVFFGDENEGLAIPSSTMPLQTNSKPLYSRRDKTLKFWEKEPEEGIRVCPKSYLNPRQWENRTDAKQGAESSQPEVLLTIRRAKSIIYTDVDKCTATTQKTKSLGKLWETLTSVV